MKRIQKLEYGVSIFLALMVLALGAYWIQATRVQAAPSDGTLLLDTSFKTVTPNMVSPGGTAYYAIVLRNSSTMTTATNITVGDALPELLSYVAGSAATVPAGRATWDDTVPGYITFTVYTLAPQTTVTLTFNAVLTQGVSPDTVISNVASLDDGVNLIWTRPATFTVSQPPAVEIAVPSAGAVVEQKAGTAFVISGHAWDDFASPPYLTAPTLSPLSSPDDDGTYYVNWTAVPLAENYVLQEAKSSDFQTSPTSYSVNVPAVSQLVSGKANGVYYYRVRAYSAQIPNPSRWSNIEVITVTQTGLQHEFAAPTAAPQSVLASQAGEIVVEVSTDNGASWHSAIVTTTAVGWDWSYAWTLPDEEKVTHVLRARARYASGGVYGAEDSISITLDNHIRDLYFPLLLRHWPPLPYAATLAVDATTVRGGNYTLSWSYSNSLFPPTSDSSYELQEASSSAFSGATVLCSPKTTSCASTRNMTIGLNKTPGVYYYRVRAWNSYGAGTWSNVIQVTVTPPVPYAPNLSAISNSDGDGNYTLNWTYTNANFLPTSYEVQEATNMTFTLNLRTPCTPGASTSCAITGKTVGTYYYRVRGVNAAGVGDWSWVQGATVTSATRNYNFDGSLEGWDIRRSDEPVTEGDNPITHPASYNNMLYTMMIGSGDFEMVSPLQAAPAVPYTIVADADIVTNETINGIAYSPKDQMKYSIIFGANGGTPCPANENTPKNQGCFSHYYRLRVRWDAADQTVLNWSLQRIDYHEGDNDQGSPPVVLAEGHVHTDANDWNKWKIQVLNTTGNNIKVYHGWGDGLIASVRDTTYINEPYYGVQIISPNWGSVAVRWDWFNVIDD